MKDIFGVPINIGATVAFNPPAYKGLEVGKVVAFTPKMVRVTCVRYGSPDTTLISPSDLVVKPDFRIGG